MSIYIEDFKELTAKLIAEGHTHRQLDVFINEAGLELAKGNQSKSARLLNISRGTHRSKLGLSVKRRK